MPSECASCRTATRWENWLRELRGFATPGWLLLRAPESVHCALDRSKLFSEEINKAVYLQQLAKLASLQGAQVLVRRWPVGSWLKSRSPVELSTHVEGPP